VGVNCVGIQLSLAILTEVHAVRTDESWEVSRHTACLPLSLVSQHACWYLADLYSHGGLYHPCKVPCLGEQTLSLP